MKRKYTIPIMLTVIVLGSTLVFRLWPRTLKAEQCSEVYQKYVGRDNIQAAFVKNKHINDSIMVDMTMLTATTNVAWISLVKDFNIAPPPREVIEITGEDCIDIHAAPKRDYSLPMDSVLIDNDLICVSWSERRISFFSIETMQQLRFLRHSLLRESIRTGQNHKLERK